MAGPEIVVFEKRPRWTPELQRQFAGEAVRVRLCRSLGDVRREGEDGGPPRVVVIDLESAPAASLQFLAGRAGRPDGVPVVLVAGPRTADLEWSARELGALAVLPEDVSGDDLAALCRRQWSSPSRGA